jgi:hypothetical protein
MTIKLTPEQLRERYVKRVFKAQEEVARRRRIQEAQGGVVELEGIPGAWVCRFEPLWAVCPGLACVMWEGGCRRAGMRAIAELRARSAVRAMRRA